VQCNEAGSLYLSLKLLYSDLQASFGGESFLLVHRKLKANAERRLRYWPKNVPGKDVKQLIRKVRKGFDPWFTFVVPGIEATNIRAERTLRAIMVQRKIMVPFGYENGTQVNKTIMTLAASWNQQGFNSYETMAKSLTEAWAKS
jgi:hypothetical protein